MGLSWCLCVVILFALSFSHSHALRDSEEGCILKWMESQDFITKEDRETNFKNVNCSAKTDAFRFDATAHLERMFRLELANNLRFMHIASHFGRDSVSRLGFRNYFQKLSDQAWERALKIVKYVARRGDQLLYKGFSLKLEDSENFYVKELESLEDLLTNQRYANKLASRNFKYALHGKNAVDPDLARFIQNEFVHEITEDIQETSGHLSNLFMMIGAKEKYLGAHLIDQTLLSD